MRVVLAAGHVLDGEVDADPQHVVGHQPEESQPTYMNPPQPDTLRSI